MVKFLPFLLLVVFQLSFSYLACADSSSEYILRVRKNHPSKRAIEIFSKRLALELSQGLSNQKVALDCLIAIKEIDPSIYQRELLKVSQKLNEFLNSPLSTPDKQEKIFSFISDISAKLSLEDGFLLIEKAGTKHLNEATRFSSDVLAQMKLTTYIQFFEKNFETIKTQPEKFRGLIEFYCLSTTLIGQIKNCEGKMTQLVSTSPPAPWATLIRHTIKMNQLDFDGASEFLKSFEMNCTSNKSLPWVNFHISRYYRMQKNTKKSLECLDIFKNDMQDDSMAMFFYYLEYGKTIRYEDIKKSETATEQAAARLQSPKNTFGFLELVVEIEKAKNFFLNKDPENTKKSLSLISSQYKINELKPYEELIQVLNSVSSESKENTKQKPVFLETYDFLTLLNSKNEQNRK